MSANPKDVESEDGGFAGFTPINSAVYGSEFPTSLGLVLANGDAEIPEAVLNHYSCKDKSKIYYVNGIKENSYGQKMGVKKGDILMTKSSSKSSSLTFGTVEDLQKSLAHKKMFITHWLRPPYPLEKVYIHESSEEEWEEESVVRAVTPEQLGKRGRERQERPAEVDHNKTGTGEPPAKRPREVDTTETSKGGSTSTSDVTSYDSDGGLSYPEMPQVAEKAATKTSDGTKDAPTAGDAHSTADEDEMKPSSLPEEDGVDAQKGQDGTSTSKKPGESMGKSVDTATSAFMAHDHFGTKPAMSPSQGRAVKLEAPENVSDKKDGKGTEDNPIYLEDDVDEDEDDDVQMYFEDPPLTMNVDSDDDIILMDDEDPPLTAKPTDTAKPAAFDNSTVDAKKTSFKALPSLSPSVEAGDKGTVEEKLKPSALFASLEDGRNESDPSMATEKTVKSSVSSKNNQSPWEEPLICPKEGPLGSLGLAKDKTMPPPVKTPVETSPEAVTTERQDSSPGNLDTSVSLLESLSPSASGATTVGNASSLDKTTKTVPEKEDDAMNDESTSTKEANSGAQGTAPALLSLETLIQRALDGEGSPDQSLLTSSLFQDESYVMSYVYEFGLVNILALIEKQNDADAQIMGWSVLSAALENEKSDMERIASILVKRHICPLLVEYMDKADNATVRDLVLPICFRLCLHSKIFMKSFVACEGSFTCLTKAFSLSLVSPHSARHFDKFMKMCQHAEAGFDVVANQLVAKEDAATATNLTNLLEMAQRYSQHAVGSIQDTLLVASLQLVGATLLKSRDSVKQTFVNKQGLTIIFNLRHKFGNNSELKEAASKAMQAAL